MTGNCQKARFSLLLAKHYLYMNKLAPKDLALDKFKAIESVEGMISKNSFLQ